MEISAILNDVVGTILGLVLTLSVFSYIFGDNFLFRLAIHIFVGVSAGYVAVMAWYNVILPQLVLPLLAGDRILFIPLVMGVLLLAKVSPRLSGIGTPVVAYLVGVGAAAAIGGALMGTIFPQVSATVNMFDLNNGFDAFIKSSIILLGTITTLLYFNFAGRAKQTAAAPGDLLAQRGLVLEVLSWIGQGFIAVTLGALFAGIYAAALAALVERLDFIIRAFLGSPIP
jgi:hypothetical protein